MELPAEQGTRLPAIARYWWLTAVRGLVALTLALAIVVAGGGTARLVTFLGLYWMVGGLITLRFALAIRPRRGARLGLAAGIAAVVGAVLVLLREGLSGLVRPDLLVGLVGWSAVLTGLLRVLGGSPPRSGWDGDGRLAASCWERWRPRSAACCC
jgi:uncharacterized membrane protein HdeD (DUF308 family)